MSVSGGIHPPSVFPLAIFIFVPIHVEGSPPPCSECHLWSLRAMSETGSESGAFLIEYRRFTTCLEVIE